MAEKKSPSLLTVLDMCADDTLLAIATALPTLVDILRLVLTSHASAQRLYFTTTSYGSSRSSSGVVVALWGTWSIAEEAARRWIADGSLKQGWVSRHSLLGRVRELAARRGRTRPHRASAAGTTSTYIARCHAGKGAIRKGNQIG